MEHNRGRRTREFDDLVGREMVKKASYPFLRAFNLGYTSEDIKSLMEGRRSPKWALETGQFRLLGLTSDMRLIFWRSRQDGIWAFSAKVGLRNWN